MKLLNCGALLKLSGRCQTPGRYWLGSINCGALKLLKLSNTGAFSNGGGGMREWYRAGGGVNLNGGAGVAPAAMVPLLRRRHSVNASGADVSLPAPGRCPTGPPPCRHLLISIIGCRQYPQNTQGWVSANGPSLDGRRVFFRLVGVDLNGHGSNSNCERQPVPTFVDGIP